MKITSLLFITTLLAVSCQKEEKASEKISAEASDSLSVLKAEEAKMINTPVATQGQQIMTTTNSANTAAVPETKPGMNPPHGQPGHRCDIQVGAPLNGSAPVAKPAAATPNQTNKTFTVSPSGNATVTKIESSDIQTAPPKPVAQTTLPGMEGKPNPAHGETGHRCDIPVGVNLP
ncbi:hypothetical protein FCR2A7T_03440 [Flavobacterium cauense R2A-7]|uniref:Uncharacterized protein n=1 Tax=Flavobacterium cauense R2A-7 TaxID=1341154 RepID=V6S637_9FLAO|nr:hypothetical protein [Flavobacterium cauense]ESU21884.1 hypothetical protein FCR2A7T_03440 [Flavobacterium cauense R2A-7]TWI13101.1 hypothetical protein IP98_01082 [Flavobacterium cauense R2A-7]